MNRKLRAPIAFLMTACLLFAGCGGNGNNEQAETPTPGNYIVYENADESIRFMHPNSWLVITDSSDLTGEEFDSVEGIGDTISQALSQASAFFYDEENSNENVIAHMNYFVSSVPGITQEDITSDATIATFKEQLLAEYESSFESFQWVTEPEKHRFGKNDFMYYATIATLEGQTLYAYQGITAANGNIYTFSYTRGDVQDDEEFQTVLSTLEFPE